MNIIDYININGHKTFEELEFNEVDGLIFAQLSYFKYNKLTTSFNDIIDSRNLNTYETSILISDKNFGNIKYDQRLIREVLSSKRYYGMRIANYIDMHDGNEEKQFSAITFIFDKFICISYMGTDDSMLGWKEDFSMSYYDFIPSQLEGVNYLNTISGLYDLPVILTGHSKGGNIAIYAASNCKEEYKDRIQKIYSYDAPGFNQKFAQSKNYLDSLNKLNSFIPVSSFVGLMMYGDDNYKIVESKKIFLLQHDPYNWVVNENGLSLKEKLSKKSLIFSETNRKWIESFTDEERKLFFNNLFALLEYDETRSFMEFKTNWKNEIVRIIKNSREISKEHKKLMIDIIGNMFTIYMKLLFNKNSTQ